MFEGVYGTNHTDYYRSLDSLARVQREWGDLDEALTAFEKADVIVQRQFGSVHAHIATVAVNKALVHLELGRSQHALLEASRGLAIYKQVYQEPQDNALLKNESTVWALFVCADALASCGQFDQALVDHSSVLQWRLNSFRQAHAHQASSYYAIAETTLALRKPNSLSDAIHYHSLAYAIRLKVFGAKPSYWLALSEAKLGQLHRDRGMLTKAHEYFCANLKPGHRRAIETGRALQQIHNKASSNDEFDTLSP